MTVEELTVQRHVYCAFRYFWEYFFHAVRFLQIAFSKKIQRCILWSSSCYSRTKHAARPIKPENFNALQKRSQSFSRTNGLSVQSLYFNVPVWVLQLRCIRELKWLWIIKPSFCTVSERKITFLQWIYDSWFSFETFFNISTYVIV